MPPKSIFRGPEAQHFQLVHRSQRDPLIHNSEVSPHVLKPIIKDNDLRKGKSLNNVESLIPNTCNDRPNVGEAAEYGILFDDTEYDYMQHLRDTTLKAEKGLESILVSTSLPISKNKVKYSDTFELKLPSDALPSREELDPAKALEAQRDIPDEIAGFHPDLNPHLRQVLKALYEVAFVEDSLDDFFGELVEGGERDIGDEDFEFYEDGGETLDKGEESWEAKFAQFKKQHGMKAPDDHEDSDSLFCTQDINVMSQTESLDTLGNLPVLMDGKRRRRGGAHTTSSGFSMTSSTVYRNPGLTLLDERFEQFYKTYDDDDDDDMISGTEDLMDSDQDVTPDLIAARDDFETAMDDFLQNYEFMGRRMRSTLQGTICIDKLDTIRHAIKQLDIGKNPENQIADGDGDTALVPTNNLDEGKERWDCETILSTYSNLENHPRLIQVRNTKPIPQVKLDLKTNLPITLSSQRRALLEDQEKEEEDSQNSDATEQPGRATITRPRNELKGEKKARKLAVKKERQVRRQDKKANQEVFSEERKHLAKVMINKRDTKFNKL